MNRVMEAKRIDDDTPDAPRVDWEAFYRNYRKPGYVPGFEIVNKLGGGMFGLVFKARKASIGKDYAIKFLKVDDDTVRDAVLREIDNVSFFAQIDHPNLVSIEDMGTVDGIPYLVMSYAGDATLQKRLAEGGLSRDEALRIFAQAARGVQALHDHSLVHFDLKPANIFLKGDVARVGDYGLSKLVSASRNSLSFGRGTPYYMAPEMLQRRGDARSDVYSLGILLYECLYGEVPFKGDSEWEVLRKHETATPEFPPEALPADKEIILRCLAKQPEDRFQSAAELLRALQAPVALGESLTFQRPAGAAVEVDRAEEARRSDSDDETPQAVRHDPVDSGNGAASPMGMPWQEPSTPNGGIVGFFVKMLFGLIEAAVRLALMPARWLGAFIGNGMVWLLQLPFRLLGAIVRLVGFLMVVALIVLVVVTITALVA